MEQVEAVVGAGQKDLAMSVTTAKSHVSSILTELGLDNRTQIALLAHDADLV